MKKKETLEEAADEWVFETNGHKWSNNDDTAGDNHYSFKNGAKWQQERMYSEEEVYNLLEQAMKDCHLWELEEHYSGDYKNLKEWFEQFKKK